MRVVRKLVRWYVGPFAAEQRSFNASILRVADEQSERLDELRAVLERQAADNAARSAELALALETLRRLEAAAASTDAKLEGALDETRRVLEEIQERLLRAERRVRTPARTAGAKAEVANAPMPPADDPDYFAFEARMRGSTDSVRERQRDYVDDFRAHPPVLDLGCGRGEFLELLAEAGIEARGVDVDADMVAFAQGEGVEVEQGDALQYLAGLEDGSLGGIFCAHVLEHFPPRPLFRLLELAAAKLRPGGLFVAETPNPLTLVALSTFFADLTHAQPLHPGTLAHLVRQAGFRDVETRYLNPPAPEARLHNVPAVEGAEPEPTRRVHNANVDRLNDVVFGPQDYAILARK
jgi:SAM-dependent methyltransferase